MVYQSVAQEEHELSYDEAVWQRHISDPVSSEELFTSNTKPGIKETTGWETPMLMAVSYLTDNITRSRSYHNLNSFDKHLEVS
jgi:hypothetical protein